MVLPPRDTGPGLRPGGYSRAGGLCAYFFFCFSHKPGKCSESLFFKKKKKKIPLSLVFACTIWGFMSCLALKEACGDALQ